MRKERTLRKGMKTKIQKQPNSETTNRKRKRRLIRNIELIGRKYTPYQRDKEN